jgi:hypothetical protein
MLTIEHEHIVLLIMLTMINFNCIALNGFLSKKFHILQTFFLCISFHLGGKISILLTGLNGLYLLMQIHLLAFPLSGAASHWSD